MMPNSYDATPIIDCLDAAYEALMDSARELQEAFFIEAKERLGDGRTHVPIVILLRKSRANSTAINWVRLFVPKGTENVAAKPYPRTIVRGTGKGNRSFKYNEQCFAFLPRKLKRLVLHYDAILAGIREQASAILDERRRILSLAEKISSVMARSADAIEHVARSV